MSAIFISHSSRDHLAADEVAQWLASLGHRSVFLDFDPEFGIPAGRNWERELYQQLRSCQAVIVLCSRASTRSRWCFAEITQARALGKVLLPVRIDDCQVDELLTAEQITDLAVGPVEALARLHRGLLAAGVNPSDMFDWDRTRPPYPGLMAFQEQDAAVFFGRSEEIGAGLDLLNRMQRLGTAGLAVVLGASGSGKSSLVRAGLVPRLRRDVERWVVVDAYRPRNDPVAEMAAVWSRAFASQGESRDRTEIAVDLQDALANPTAPNPLLAMAGDLRRAANRSEARVVLIVDQLEEALGPLPADCPGVLRLLRAAAEAQGGPLLVLATLRSDFFGVFKQHPALLGMRCELSPVGPMLPEGVTQVIVEPARLVGLEVETGLLQAMLADVGSEVGAALPLLAFTLRRLFDRSGADGRLDVKQYRELGGLQGSVAGVADDLLSSQPLEPDMENDLRRAFLALARLNDDGRWVRRVVPWEELPGPIHPILEQFVAARLLVSSGDGDTRTLEVAHEVLFRAWGRLSDWLEQDVGAQQVRRIFEQTGKWVLILGQFPPERAAILRALRDGLHAYGYVPVLFDFAIPTRRDLNETVVALAYFAQFVVVDLTDPKLIARELSSFVPMVRVPVVPIMQRGHEVLAMVEDLNRYPWVLPIHYYDDKESLLAELRRAVIEPAEGTMQELSRQ